MWKYRVLLLVCFAGYSAAGPLGLKKNMPILQREDESMNGQPVAMDDTAAAEKPASAPEMMMVSTLTLPSNATSIRADITDGFSCTNKTYGYYADVDNDCQIFHVCLPVTYADGKENTFRWSFICPEETIFSQESFTCMRPEDMTIDCEESFKYYELNRNFGMIDEEPKKNTASSSSNSAGQSATNEEQAAMSSHVDQQIAVEKETVVMQPVMANPVLVPMPAQVQPMKPAKPNKPTKIQKPNRRKPAQKQPLENSLLHKIVLATPTEPKITIGQLEQTTQTLKEAKPIHNRFTKRPTTMSTTIKQKIQPAKLESTHVRTELYSQKNKRPTYFNKKNPTPTMPQEDGGVTAVKPELNEPEPILKLETMFTVTHPKHDTSPIDTSIEKVKLAEPAKEPVEASETEPQASESVPVIVKLAEDLKSETPKKTAVKDNSLMEATENKDTLKEDTVKEDAMQANDVNEESVQDDTVRGETTIMDSTEKEDSIKEISEQTDFPKNDEESIAISTPIKESNTGMAAIIPSLAEGADTQNLKDTPIVENIQTPIEAFEEIPAVIVETEEAAKMPTFEVNTLVKMDETHMRPMEQNQKTENIEILSANPQIFEENSEESMIVPTIEELENAKPVDAVETMPAIPEMEHQSALVQQMFPESEEMSQSMGSFKPVDPLMAAEAEALITEFLNTLKKADVANSEPIMPGQSVEPGMASIQAEPQSMEAAGNAVMQEAENEKNEVIAMKPNDIAPETPAADITGLKNIAANEKEDADDKPQMLENAAAMSTMKLNNFRNELYQIPVKVIETSVEDQGSSMPTEEKIKAEESMTSEQQVPSYSPISIDDIVELVKERLDQVPVAEKDITKLPANEEHNAQIVTIDEKPINEQSVEEIIMPIYHRVSEPDSASLKMQTTVTSEEKPISAGLKPVETEPVEQVVQPENIIESAVKIGPDTIKIVEAAEKKSHSKANRAYRSRSIGHAKMDPRKRRFLFRSDSR